VSTIERGVELTTIDPTTYLQERTIMGSGDRRTRRGKIWQGTFGKSRPRNKKKLK
jgi:30S ribosomal protein S31